MALHQVNELILSYFLSVTSGNQKEKGKGCQETYIKDPWTKPKGGRVEGGRKWRQVY